MKILVEAADYEDLLGSATPSLAVNRGLPISLGDRVMVRDGTGRRTWRGIVVRVEEEDGKKRLHLARGTGEMIAVRDPKKEE